MQQENQDDHGEKINQDKKDAAMKKTDQKKDFKSLRAETKIIKLGDKGKTVLNLRWQRR